MLQRKLDDQNKLNLGLEQIIEIKLKAVIEQLLGNKFDLPEMV